MTRVFLVEDDEAIRDVVFEALSAFHEYRTDWAASAEEALTRRGEYDIIILDIMLPGLNGIELCALLRKTYLCPILFLSALDDASTIVEALNHGGDDYVTKPFDAPVLHARIQANLRRVQMERKHYEQARPVVSETMQLDTTKGILRKNGKEITLLPIETRLLAFLMENSGRYYKAKELYREIWGMDDLGNTKTVLVHMHNLRGKVEDDPQKPVHILNVRGKGYTFNE